MQQNLTFFSYLALNVLRLFRSTQYKFLKNKLDPLSCVSVTMLLFYVNNHLLRYLCFSFIQLQITRDHQSNQKKDILFHFIELYYCLQISGGIIVVISTILPQQLAQWTLQFAQKIKLSILTSNITPLSILLN